MASNKRSAEDAELSREAWEELKEALDQRDREKANRIIAKFPKALDECLYVAVVNEPIDRIQELLEVGANPHGGEGDVTTISTALSYSYIDEQQMEKRDYSKIIMLLIEHSTDIDAPLYNSPDSTRATALHGIIELADHECDAPPFDERDYQFTLLDLVYKVLAKGATIDKATVNGTTALHIAVQDESIHHIAEYLFSKGASLTIANKEGDTAISLAEEAGNTSLLKFLKERNNRPRAATTALLIPLYIRFLEAVLDQLREAEWMCDTDIENRQQFAALSLALYPSAAEERSNVETWRIALSILYNKFKYETVLGEDEDGTSLSLVSANIPFVPPALLGEELAWVEPFTDVATPDLVQTYQKMLEGHDGVEDFIRALTKIVDGLV
jgi:Ankyrin repeats (3 copies)